MDRTLTGYKSIPNQEKKRSEGFERLEEYEYFYLCGRYRDGRLLYKECFSKFDIDGVTNPKMKRECVGKTHRGL